MSWQEYAWRRLTDANPFPSVMGRVCPAPCETGCNRNEVEDHVGINSVEHFLGEYAIANKLAFAAPPEAHRQEGRDHRRRPGRAVVRVPACAQGPRGGDLRRARASGRDDALRHPGIPDAARGARRRNPAHRRHGGQGLPEDPHRHRHHAGIDPRRLRRGVPRHGRAIRAPAAGPRRRRAERRHRHLVPQGLQRRPAAPRRQARRRHRRR